MHVYFIIDCNDKDCICCSFVDVDYDLSVYICIYSYTYSEQLFMCLASYTMYDIWHIHVIRHLQYINLL